MSDSNSTGPWGKPSQADMLVPPFVFVILFVIVLATYSVLSQPLWWKLCFKKRNKSSNIGHAITVKTIDINQDSLFTREDHDLLTSFKLFQNRPWPLFKLSLPCLLSVLFCPIIFIIAPDLKEFLYPKKYGGMPNINDSVSAFLTPAGLVYAIAFGIALENAFTLQKETAETICEYITLLKHSSELVDRIGFNNEDKRQMTVYLKDYVMQWMALIIGETKENQEIDGFWKVTSIIRRESNKTVCENDEHFVGELFAKLFQIDTIVSKFTFSGNQTIHVAQWIFLELLAFITFFGILLVKAQSYRLELTMCILTVFTISLFAYIVADLDEPYHGFFRTDTSCFAIFLDHLNEKHCKHSGNNTSKSEKANGLIQVKS